MPTLDLRALSRGLRPQIPDLPHLRRSAIGTWKGRMVNEHSSAIVFEGLAKQLGLAGFPESVVTEALTFAAEERRHGALCGAVVEALGGEAIAEVPDGAEYPFHEDAKTPLEALLRNMLSICCLSETVAVALIGAERLEMPSGELRDLLTGIYADEVGHARFGWRILGELGELLDAETKERLGAYLEVAFEHLVDHELAHLPETSQPPPEGAAYGLCSGPDARRLFFGTIREVIVPGLEQRGIPAGLAWQQTRFGAAA